jgi:SAM-dependent methyltransferase
MLLNKVCEIEDFLTPELHSLMQAWFGLRKEHCSNWPIGWEDRKFWETCMTLLAVDTLIPTSSRTMALGVGAGIEATSFILSNSFRWVFVTDLYGKGSWNQDAPGSMLVRPEKYAASLPTEPRRLVVQHMDARNLRFENGTFDLVYSCSAIEHFGTVEDIKIASREIGRVLKPGGLMSISTELCLSGSSQWLGNSTMLLKPADIFDLIVKPSGCEMVDEPNFTPSQRTLMHETSFERAMGDLQQGGHRLDITWSSYPHIVISTPDASWTSVQLTLRKPE